MSKQQSANTFSSELLRWQKSRAKKTIESLNDIADEKSFAIIFLLLMSVPALPIPTAGITHVFEVIVGFLCLELIIGRNTLWLPKKWQQSELPKSLSTHAIPRLIKILKWLERYTRPRLAGMLKQREFLRLTGLVVLTFTIASAVAPPFSGLDTLPALGVVVVAAGLLLEDVILYVAGCVVGAFGVAVMIGFSAIIVELVNKVF